MGILELEDLTYSYDGMKNKVLEDVNYVFEKGRIYAIVGKSGTGKTTLLSLLSGLTKPTTGKIIYNKEDIQKIDKYKYRSRMVGVIFQGYNLLPQLTAEENVMLSLEISGKKEVDRKDTDRQEADAGDTDKREMDKRTVVNKALQAVQLGTDKANRRVLKLSGGEQQRVAIARALCYDPDIVLADEPTGNLDAETERGIMDILSSLAKEQDKCVIIVTHSPKVAEYADDIIYMDIRK